MSKQITGGFDFSEWSRLASSDPGEFERRRELLIAQLILSAPESRRQRLRCLQWRIDQVRRRSRTPMAACLQISRMMWESVVGEDGLLEAIQDLRGPRRPAVASSARVLSFPAPRAPKSPSDHLL